MFLLSTAANPLERCFFLFFSVLLTRREKRVKPSSLSPGMRDTAGGQQLALNQCQLLLLLCNPVPGARAPRLGSLGWCRALVLDKTGAKLSWLFFCCPPSGERSIVLLGLCLMEFHMERGKWCPREPPALSPSLFVRAQDLVRSFHLSGGAAPRGEGD